MNFYASSEYLSVVAGVYFPGRETRVEDVLIGDAVLRLLIVDGRQVVTSLPFLDYHMPLTAHEARTPRRRIGYVENVVCDDVEISELSSLNHSGLVAAPYVDWSQITDFESYLSRIKEHSGGLLKELLRRRRRLADAMGDLEFRMHDDRPDVMAAARAWKSAQLRRNGIKDFFARKENVDFFDALAERKLLVASTLRASGRLLSVWLGYVHEGKWSGWVFTYDPDEALKKYSVGRQLLHSMIEESQRCGHREFDFSIGAEDYKLAYATRARLLANLGAPALHTRIGRQAREGIKAVVSLHPASFEQARRLVRALRNSDSLERMRYALAAIRSRAGYR